MITPDNIDVLLLTALPKENAALLSLLVNQQTTTTPNEHVVSRGVTTNGLEIVAGCICSMGATAAAVYTLDLINTFNPKRIILTGIAGGLSDDVAMGDVLVSEQVVDFEIAKIGEKSVDRRWSAYRNDPVFLEIAKTSTDQNWKNVAKDKIPKNHRSAFEPRVHFGVVMSGNKIVANHKEAESFVTVWTKAIGVEMEGAGVGGAVLRKSIPFSLVKAVSDKSDAKKNDEWQEYAAATAAAYAISIINQLPSTPKAWKRPEFYEPFVQGTQMPMRAFRMLVAQRFSLSELKALSFDLNIDWEEIGGDTKTDRVIELYRFCERKDRLLTLIRLVDKETNGGVTKYHDRD